MRRISTFSVLASTAALLIAGCRSESPVAAGSDALTILSISPTRGRIGDHVMLTGRNFHPVKDSNHVLFLRVADYWLAAAAIDSMWPAASPTHMRVTAPNDAITGKIAVHVGSGWTYSDSTFTIVQGGPASITGIAPTNGAIGGRVVISGSAFDTKSVLRVMFGSIPAQVDSATTTMILVRVPPGASSGEITVISSIDTLHTPLFTVVPAAITSFAPTSGMIATVVALSTNFIADSTTSVKCGAVALPVLAHTDTSITVRIAPGSTSAPFVVTTRYGFATTGSLFTVVPRGHVITGFSPTWGKRGRVDSIYGRGFGTDTIGMRVFYGGDAAAKIVSVTDGRIVAFVPSGAVTGAVRVEIYGERAVSANLFTVYSGRYPFDTCEVSVANVRVVRRTWESGPDKQPWDNYDRMDTVVASIVNSVCNWSGGFRSDPARPDSMLLFWGFQGLQTCRSNVTVTSDSAHSILPSVSAWWDVSQSGSEAGGSIDLSGIPFVVQSDGSLHGEVIGTRAQPLIHNLKTTSWWSQNAHGGGTDIEQLVSCDSTSVVRVTLK